MKQVTKQKIQLLKICSAFTGMPEFAQLDQASFCHYPCPAVVIHDNRTEFTGCNFQDFLESCGVKGKPTREKNLQANLLVKWLYGSVGDQLCTMAFEGSDFYKDL